MSENFEQVLKGIYENKQEAIEESNAHFQKEERLIDYISASLGALSLATLGNTIKENEILDINYPATDMWFSAHLTNIINTVLSIKDLCINGFDTQARSLVRTLDERIYQTLILFSSAEDYDAWKNTEDSKQAHYELFSKKKSILKKITKLDSKYLSLSASNHDFLRSLRRADEEYYSDCIHGASVSVVIGSLAYPFGDLEEGPFVSSLFGRASSCSFQTLHHVIGQMAYFTYMLNAILMDIHSIQGVNKNEYVDMYCTSQSKIIKLSQELLFAGFNDNPDKI
ncbi:hypothetical protein TW85_04315 [Marinomonas sp. S3726]|uniref:DUF5677 domain-containing protein n=1 Tax=Marinomonas sp. S3726 TaxID=579484 RepID=UPI0005FA6D1F|nr:DUF5677 domain-containing protein [Marinomonas sp. S3726]KJZ16088.1 hypothetical protein TW85_04315 [Marinomonas sp. S3726]